MSLNHSEAERILEKALGFEGEARAGYLTGACGENSELRDRVETLIQAHEAAESFLGEGVTLGDPTSSEGLGSVIGRYKILQQVGEGGMGAVYMAEQTEPVSRKVALKIIKLGMDTKQVVARFEAERQALAMMDHPNIAKVLDAGATEAGRPYFVMELVRGVPVTEYCDKNKLSTKQRLELFIPICQAIQHAHQKGVIHRDVKPSNVMVTLHDGNPVPKVIDFGIAKATNQKLTEKTLFTNYAQMIGTPAYMSPEQAEMSGLDVDTRTDVYSLGVLLYELLTGTTPFPSQALMSQGYGEMQRIIAEEEPPKPSTRLSTMQNEEQTVVAGNRSMEVSALGRVFQGDLDWIVMRALEKDRTRRYETVNGLVEDIRRHLGNEPVAAAAPTFSYKLAKFYRRYRAQTRAAVVVALVLILSVSLGVREAIQSAFEKNRADQEAIRGDGIASLLVGTLEESIPELMREGDFFTAQRLMDRTGTRARRELEHSPQAEARLRIQMIQYYFYFIEDYPKAFEHAQRLEELFNEAGHGFDEDLFTSARAQLLIARVSVTPKNSPDWPRVTRELKEFVDSLEGQSGVDPWLRVRCVLRSAVMSYYLWGMPEEAGQRLAEGLAWFPENPTTSWVFWRVMETCNLYARKGYDVPGLQWLSPENLNLPERPDARLAFYMSETFRHHALLLSERAAYQDGLEFFQAVDGKDAKGTFPIWLQAEIDFFRLYFESRLRKDDALLPEIEKLASSQEATWNLWSLALIHSAYATDLNTFRRLRLLGLVRFIGPRQGVYARRVMRYVMLHPLSDGVLEAIRERLYRAFRQRDFQGILTEVEKLTANASNRINLERWWSWRMMKAFALLNLGENEAALKWYWEGMKVRGNILGEDFPEGQVERLSYQDVVMLEVQQAFQEAGLIESDRLETGRTL